MHLNNLEISFRLNKVRNFVERMKCIYKQLLRLKPHQVCIFSKNPMNLMKREISKHFILEILLICFLLAPIASFSQKNNKQDSDEDNDDSQNKSWSFLINAGTAFANKYHANFYNGAEGNENEINYVFDNYYWNQDIQVAVGDTFNLVGLPTNMKYSPAFCVGFGIKKKFNNYIGIIAQFNFSRFNTNDEFTLKIGSTPSGTTTNANLRNYPIFGKEDRINIDLGVSGEIPLANKISGFLEGGFNLNNTRVKENGIAIEYLEYSIINVYADQNYVPGAQIQEYMIKQGGIGIGLFLSPGVEFKFNDKVAIDLLGSIYWSQINLEHYNQFRPHYNIMIRFVFSTNVEVMN